MLRKVYRIKQEIAKRHELGMKMRKKIGKREKRIVELERERKVTADYLASLLRASEGLVNGSETFYGYPNLMDAWIAASDHLIEINYSVSGYPPTVEKAG